MKLTKAIRTNILDKLLEHRFKEDVLNLAVPRQKLASKIARKLVPLNKTKLLDDLPKGWLPEANNVSVQFGHTYTKVYFNGDMDTYRYPSIRRIKRNITLPSKRLRLPFVAYDGTFCRFPVDHELTLEFDSIVRTTEALEEAITVCSNEVQAVLNSVTTDKALIAQWPEVAPYVPTATARASANLPAIPTAHLNAMLDLASKEKS